MAEWKRLMHIAHEPQRFKRDLCSVASLSIAVSCVLSIILPSNMWPFAFLFALTPPLILIDFHKRGLERAYDHEERRILMDSPLVMGLLTISLLTDRSLERAISFVVSNIEGPLSDRLRMVGWRSATGGVIGNGSAADAVLSTMSSTNRPVARALAIAMSSVHEVDPGMSRTVLDRANRLLLDGLRERMGRFIPSLQMPFMVVFTINIMVPMILITMMPLLNYGGSQNSSMPVVIILFIMIPLGLSLARAMVGRNPFRRGEDVSRKTMNRGFIAILMSLSTLLTLTILIPDIGPALMALFASLSMIPAIFLMKGDVRDDVEASVWADSMERIGNRLLSGMSMMRSLSGERLKAIKVQAMSLKLSDIRSRDRLYREAGLGPLALQAVTRLAEKDSGAAGIAAIHLGRFLSDVEGFQERLETELRSISDMMRSTMLFIAPMVFAMTLSMANLMGIDAALLETVMIVYLVSLVLMVSYISSFVKGGGWGDMLDGSIASIPISITVFIIASEVSRYFLPAIQI